VNVLATPIPARPTARRIVQAVHEPTASEEEARSYLQERLALLFNLMFWSIVVLLGFLWFLYREYDEIAPKRQSLVFVGSAVGLAIMAFVWRVLLVRRELAASVLYRLDLVYSIGIGLGFGASAFVQKDLHAAGYLSLVYSTFTVYARALIVPSSARRTLASSSATFVPMTISAVVLAFEEQELPGIPYFLLYLMLCVVPIVLSSFGSRTIYGLRRQANIAKQLGQYTLERKIGGGGMGEVHLAHHVLLRRPTAIKLLRPDRVGAESIERFEGEVQHTSQLTHPNTVAVFDYGRNPDGVFYYAMEYLDGIDLEKLVTKHGPQPPGRVASVLAQVCGALHEAHARGIVHRDVKPSNIILCERGLVPDVAKVVDFGLVKEFTADTGASAQVVLGTPGYLAPEAVTDPSRIGPASDLYALGAVGYFLATGKRVFDGTTAVEVCMQHVTQAPKPPSQLASVPPELEAVILKCLAKRPQDRYASAEELGDALRALPEAPGWNDHEAARWWRERHDAHEEEAVASSTPTLTITVDLGHRA
jgi:serine/threonine-protein kinase